MKRKNINAQKYALVALITCMIFLLGLFVGGYSANKKLAKIYDLENQLQMETLSVETQYSILEDDLCSEVDFAPLTEQLFEIGKKLSFMENSMGNHDDNVLRLKEYYSILEIKHWLLVKKRNEQCSGFDAGSGLEPDSIILYFYSNKGNCPRCEEQGYVLSYIHEAYKQIKVYSFDVNLENAAISTLKGKYGITADSELPVLVIDGTTHTGFMNRKHVEDAVIR